MKKYVVALLLALSLTGCRNTSDNNATQNDRSRIGEDMRDGIDEMDDDIRNGVNDITDGTQGSYNGMNGNSTHGNSTNGTTNNGTTDDGTTNDSTDQNTTGPYGYGLPEEELWTVPSFCNAMLGRPNYRGR